MNKDEALKLALEALEMAHELEEGYGIDFKKYGLEFDKDIRAKYATAITVIKQALAAPNLQAELVKANAQAEHFEREWYLRGDELEATNRQVEILSDALAESRREVAALKAVQEPVAWEDVLGAIARGWTHPENAQKPMDVQLAVAIAKEIQDMYTTPPAAQRQHLTDGSLCWCEPKTSYTDPETGASVVVHKGPQ